MPKNTPTYKIYSAGPLFTQHDLTSNVLMKRAVWEQSNGKYELILPQSKEKREPGEEDIATFIRNYDLLQMVKCDLVLARFDGVELDTGTVVEFMLAKFLGKGTLILRSDSRRQGSDLIDEPYNLMVKNWPRTIEMHVDALVDNYQSILQEREERGEISSYHDEIALEMHVAEKGIRNLAGGIIKGLEQVVKLPSPYPQEYKEMVYRQVRYMLGGGFKNMLTDLLINEILSEQKEKNLL